MDEMTEEEVYDALWPALCGDRAFVSYAYCNFGSADSAADIEDDAINALVEQVVDECPGDPQEALGMALSLLRRIAKAEAEWAIHDPGDEDPANLT